MNLQSFVAIINQFIISYAKATHLGTTMEVMTQIGIGQWAEGAQIIVVMVRVEAPQVERIVGLPMAAVNSLR